MNQTKATPRIILKSLIDETDFRRIQELERVCTDFEPIALKLELEYKLADAQMKSDPIDMGPIRELMYEIGDEIIGYLGISTFGGQDWEVTGMVHPAWRRKGIFKTLYRLMCSESACQKPGGVLLLCDRHSPGGRAFLATTGAVRDHCEHEMFLRPDFPDSAFQTPIRLRQADRFDIPEIQRQNKIYFDFGSDPIDSDSDVTDHGDIVLIPEEEELRGMTIYIAELDQIPVGKVHIQRGSDFWGIYGLGVLPEYRSLGYGRAILSLAVSRMRSLGAPAVMLQVDADNDRALSLYQSCGFESTSTMDYYRL